jgi:hypothetical protein
MTRILPFIILTLLGCSSKKQANNLAKGKFKTPTIIQHKTIDTATYFNEENVVEVWPKFIGQFKFTDTIFYSGESEKRDSVSEKQYLWEQREYEFDTLSSDGLQILADYESSIIYADKSFDDVAHYFYPVYIVNETAEPKVFIGKDSYVFAIQEALDTSDYSKWFAIEGRGFDFCGNGYFRRKVLPNEFIMFLFPKYSGLEKTLLRVRLKLGDNLIISKPFKGEINRNQVSIKKGSWFYEELKETKGKSANWMFYGAATKGIDKF